MSEPVPAEDPLCGIIDPLTMIDDVEVAIAANTSTSTSPAKSDVEQSNIVSSTASGLIQLQMFLALKICKFKPFFH